MTNESETPQEPTGEFILYTTEDGKSRGECRFENETIWLSQALIAELFDRSKKTISEHLQNLFEEEELDRDSVVRNFRTTAADGKSYEVLYYSLEAILAVGFRVRSRRGTQFRRWANTRLREYLVKGFTMDDQRLKNPPVAGAFDALSPRQCNALGWPGNQPFFIPHNSTFIITAIGESLAADYELSRKETVQFFRIIQNKLHFAATGQTAAELIASRADASKPNMGLTVWKGEIVLKQDVSIAKNYLNESEIDELNRIVVMWLDFAEDQAKRRKQIFLKDWQSKLDEFLRFNDRDILPDSGKVSKQDADKIAAEEYERFAQRRRHDLEEAGASDSIKQLEDLSKHPPSKQDEG